MNFKAQILQGIPSELPKKQNRSSEVSHAPKRKEILSLDEKKTRNQKWVTVFS